MTTIMTKCTFFWFFLPAAFLVATPSVQLKKSEIYELIERSVAAKPLDREILFIGLLFTHMDKAVVFDTATLEEMMEEVEDVKASRWQRKFAVEPKYRSWLLESLNDLIIFNKTKRQDMFQLAQKMTDASLELNEALEHMSRRQLLFLIQYTSQQPAQTKLAESPRQITAAQLLEVLMTEQNQRVARSS